MGNVIGPKEIDPKNTWVLITTLGGGWVLSRVNLSQIKSILSEVNFKPSIFQVKSTSSQIYLN